MKQIKNFCYFLLVFSLNSCSNTATNHNIATIDEASGISYCQNSKTLIVANDEGSYYEIRPDGKILTSYKLGEYDLEGVVCEEKRIVFAVEDKGLLLVDRKTQKTQLLLLKGKKFKLSKKSGIEGITKIDKKYYLSIQAKKKKNSKILIVKAGKNYAKIEKIINHRIIDSAGMEFHNNKLYIVSDKKDKLYIYSLKREKVLKKIKLPKFAQEGITFDNNENIYFADDDGAVLKYTKKELGL